MSVPSVLFCPTTYGHTVETSLLALLGRHVSQHVHAMQLRCNGALLQCDRDATTSFHRRFESCLECMAQSADFATWTGASLFQVTAYLPAADVERSKRWLSTLEADELPEAHFDGVAPFAWCTELFNARFQQIPFQAHNKQHELFMRRHMLSVIRTRLSVRRFLFTHKPDLIFAVEAQEVFSRALAESAQDIGLNLITLSSRADGRRLELEQWHTSQRLTVDLLIQDYKQVRHDMDTWPEELREQLQSIAQFAQLDLPQRAVQTSGITRAVHGR